MMLQITQQYNVLYSANEKNNTVKYNSGWKKRMGIVKSKQEFIKEIGIPPSYYKVSETIVDPIFKIHDNVIVFCYKADLLLEAFGQKRLTEICQTDMWIKKNNHWFLIASEALDKPNFPERQKVSERIMKEVNGVYQIGEKVGYRVFQDSLKLFIQRFGGKRNELICETDFVFYLAGNPLLRYVFVHDSENKITQLKVLRSDGGFIFKKTE